jgi:CHAT domain-containing protein
MTSQEAERYCKEQIEELKNRGELVPTWLSEARQEYWLMTKEMPNSRPFAHPYYWAAFALYGITEI